MRVLHWLYYDVNLLFLVRGIIEKVGESFLKTRDMPLELTEAMKLKSKEEIQEWSQNNKTKLRLQLVEFMQMCMRLMQIYGDVLKAMKQEAANDKKAQGEFHFPPFFILKQLYLLFCRKLPCV